MAASDSIPEIEAPSRYVSLDRAAWQRLSHTTPLPLTDKDVARLRGLGDPIDLAEVDAIYRPMSRLLNLYSTATERMHAATSTFLGAWNIKFFSQTDLNPDQMVYCFKQKRLPKPL